MPVFADRASRPERRSRWRRSRTVSMDPVRTARHIHEALKEGLAGPKVSAAARGLRRLLDVDGVGLVDLSGVTTWAGTRADSASMINEVLHADAQCGRPPLVATPLHVRDELVGVLVVAGDTPMSAVREAVKWVEDALENGRLEASAEQAAQAELRALRAEISPHFMYNALTVIGSLVRSDPDRARELTLDFADFIRYGLARHREYTTVSDEFHAIETYLALQRAVLGDRLRVQIQVAPDVLAVAIPYLVLQPLVENAVRHGIEPLSGPGLVQIRGEAEGSDLVMSVEDDGVGMDPTRTERILAGQEPETSMGLTNVDRRLRSVYGSWFGLVVETAKDSGTRVVVRVPLFQPGVVP
jgi:two-component system LytT family sensor kinase